MFLQAAHKWDATLGAAFYLHPPKSRCNICSDLLLPIDDKSLAYCSLNCWFQCEGVAVPQSWISALIDEDFGDRSMDAFCVSCACAFRRGGGGPHDGHVYLPILRDAQSSSVEIPTDHVLGSAWANVRDSASHKKHLSKNKNRLLLIRDESPRCNQCKGRLEDDVPSCRVCLACVVQYYSIDFIVG